MMICPECGNDRAVEAEGSIQCWKCWLMKARQWRSEFEKSHARCGGLEAERDELKAQDNIAKELRELRDDNQDYQALEAERDELKAECGRLRDIDHKQLDYGITLQRMIESICDGRPIPEEGRNLHHAELIRNSAFIIRRP